MDSKRSCWTGLSDYIYDQEGYSDAWAEAFTNDATCLLPHGHDGPHEWIPDDQIGVSFNEPPPEPAMED